MVDHVFGLIQACHGITVRGKILEWEKIGEFGE